MLDFRPDLPRRGMRGQERPKQKYPPLWRDATVEQHIDGPDARGRYRLSVWAYNRCCMLQQYGPIRVCVMGDHGFLVQVDVEGDIR
ncbi:MULTISPECIES: hypothetical protein [Delftia]|uniref:hypothetical protein n=1 Tax=Delftia sp. UME58 TaxID=1862322 RepID=UPI001601BF86|nr:hypothetical protein [Delftia sp. UME58]MBB1651668.1 hypothetical protein [Delftia sp. UME58]